MVEKITVILMLEILGKPSDYVKEMLEKIVESLGKERETRIINKNIAEPKKIENQEAWTSFAEVEFETTLNKLMLLIFAYMPSHIDIITPEELKIKNSDLNLFFNELARKLHQYDEVARTIMIERQEILKAAKDGRIRVEKSDVKQPKKKKKS